MAEKGTNILSVLTREMGMSSRAAKCVLSFGQVYLNDRKLGPEEYVVPADEAEGAFVHVFNRVTRLGFPRFTEGLYEDVEPGGDDTPPHTYSCECEECEDWWEGR
jgi:hypothetical protein